MHTCGREGGGGGGKLWRLYTGAGDNGCQNGVVVVVVIVCLFVFVQSIGWVGSPSQNATMVGWSVGWTAGLRGLGSELSR